MDEKRLACGEQQRLNGNCGVVVCERILGELRAQNLTAINLFGVSKYEDFSIPSAREKHFSQIAFQTY